MKCIASPLIPLLCLLLPIARAGEGSATGPAPGHSDHGQVFNEGPRQAAYLMKNLSKAVKFEVSTKNELAQKFFNQGVAQLHGFWYFEAERSFRQAASLDPDCAMAYWGMAMANVNNAKRARDFLKAAVQRKEKASSREKMWIDALAEYHKEDKRENKVRRREYVRALEKIVLKYPKDIEAKAFLVYQIWDNREQLPISSHASVNALLDAVLAQEPMHPAHHYRIHLWDDENAENALQSAARCGQSAPGIAHMWHMPGHTFSKLNRHLDAAWQQEASQRTDHAYMQQDRVLPDQIHNYAHNAEWLIRTFNQVGRAQDALTVAKNMIEIPRHPAFNTLGKTTETSGRYDRSKNTAQYGRARLFETLVRWELWDELETL